MTLLFALLLAAAAPPSTEEMMVVNLSDAKFAPATTPGIPPTVQNSPIGIDPNTKGGTGYGKFAPGAKIPEHWHSYAEYTVLISGGAVLTLDGKKHDIVAGSYFIIPAKTKHALECGAAAECVLLTRRAGPTDYNFTAK